jgi:hypothetical protein
MSKHLNTRSHKGLGSVLTALGLALAAPMASAQALSTMVNGWRTQGGALADTLTMASFLMGVFFLVVSITKFYAWSKDEQRNSVKTPIILLFLSALAIGLPFLAGFGQATLGITGTKTSVDGSVYSSF